MVKPVGLLALLSLLGACASQPAPPASWTRWVCDSQAEVMWRAADSAAGVVDVRLGAGATLYRLRQEVSGSGALYSDGVLSLHTQGDEGLVYWTASDKLIGRGCKAPE
jgi:membrane-bound inhibitor of C-type lysozyme